MESISKENIKNHINTLANAYHINLATDPMATNLLIDELYKAFNDDDVEAKRKAQLLLAGIQAQSQSTNIIEIVESFLLL